MTRAAVPQVAFSSGEVSPLVHRRFDYQRAQTGMRSCRGFLPLRQGGFTRAPGTLHRGPTRNNASARLVDFEFAANDAVVLEFTDFRMRVWRYGQLVMNGGAPYELVTPFPASSLPLLQWVQSADVIWITDGLRPIQRLSRFALANWSIQSASFTTGPFRVQNLNAGQTIQASATTGVVTLSANFALFTAQHVGSIIQLAQESDPVPLWTGNTAIAVGQRMRNDGKCYVLENGNNTGVNPPTHEEGLVCTSLSPAVWWRYVDNGVGTARITAVGPGGFTATAQVMKAIPQGVVSYGTYRWSEGAWSDRYGYPSVLEIFDQRLVAAGSPSEPRTIWFSAAGAFDDFTPGTDADSAFAYAIAGTNSVNRITWLQRGKAGLHIGALGEEYSTRTTDRGQAIGPATTSFGLDSSIGGRERVRPLAPDGRPIFVSKDGRRIFEIAYAFQEDANTATELSLPADHLGDSGFEELAWQSAPLRVCWARRGNGELAAMMHEPDQQVLGWAPYSLAGGFVESMAVTPDATGTHDVVTMVVRRTIGGQTVRWIEEMAAVYGISSAVQPIADAVHLFAASVFAPPAPAATFAVPHLAGETVTAWTDNGEFAGLVADGAGNVTLPAQVSQAVIGLFDATHMAETLDLLGVAPDGNTMGRPRRLTPKVKVGLHRTAAGKIAAVERDIGTAEYEGARQNILQRGVAADLSQAFSGVARCDVACGNAPEISLRFYPVGGAPMTVTALISPVTEGGQ